MEGSFIVIAILISFHLILLSLLSILFSSRLVSSNHSHELTWLGRTNPLLDAQTVKWTPLLWQASEWLKIKVCSYHWGQPRRGATCQHTWHFFSYFNTTAKCGIHHMSWTKEMHFFKPGKIIKGIKKYQCLNPLPYWSLKRTQYQEFKLRKTVSHQSHVSQCKGASPLKPLACLLLFSCSVMSDFFVTPRTVAHKASMSMGFLCPRPECPLLRGKEKKQLSVYTILSHNYTCILSSPHIKTQATLEDNEALWKGPWCFIYVSHNTLATGFSPKFVCQWETLHVQ